MLSGCSSLSPEETEEDKYPVFFPKLLAEDLTVLNEEYHRENENLICSTLNQYGFTGFSRVLFPNNENPCLSRTEIKTELPFSNGLVTKAKHALVKNAKYTGVSNSDELIVSEIISLDGCTICEGPNINNVPLQWKVTFRPQIYKGVEVLDTEIVVYVDANGVNRIWGNWYEVADPGFIEVGSNSAKEAIVGLKLRYANEMNQIFEQQIAADHMPDTPVLNFGAIKVDNGIELHKIWVVDVYLENTNEIKWKVYVSTQTGKVLDSELL